MSLAAIGDVTARIAEIQDRLAQFSGVRPAVSDVGTEQVSSSASQVPGLTGAKGGTDPAFVDALRKAREAAEPHSATSSAITAAQDLLTGSGALASSLGLASLTPGDTSSGAASDDVASMVGAFADTVVAQNEQLIANAQAQANAQATAARPANHAAAGPAAFNPQASSTNAPTAVAARGTVSAEVGTTMPKGVSWPEVSKAVQKWFPVFEEAARKHGIEPAVLAAVAQQESGGNARATSPAGALGLMQFMPATAKSMGVDPLNPQSAIDGAARYLASNLKQFGTLEKALAAYNAGPGNVSKYGGVPPFAETQNYVKRITAMLKETR